MIARTVGQGFKIIDGDCVTEVYISKIEGSYARVAIRAPQKVRIERVDDRFS